MALSQQQNCLGSSWTSDIDWYLLQSLTDPALARLSLLLVHGRSGQRLTTQQSAATAATLGVCGAPLQQHARWTFTLSFPSILAIAAAGAGPGVFGFYLNDSGRRACP